MFKDSCRLCCENEGIIDLFNKTDALTPYYKILYCFDKSKVCVDINDNLPKQICLQCEDDLSHCYNFMLKSEAATKKFCSLKLVQDTKCIDDVLNDLNNKYNNGNDIEVDNCSPEVKSEDNISDDDNSLSNAILPLKEEKLKRKSRKQSNKVEVDNCSPEVKSEDNISDDDNSLSNAILPLKEEKLKRKSRKQSNKVEVDNCSPEVKSDDDKSLSNAILPLKEEKLKRKSRKQSNKVSIQCPTCGKCFLYNSVLLKHIYMHLQDTTSVVNKDRKSKISIDNTENNGKRVKRCSGPKECPVCHKICLNNSLLISHLKKHTGVRPFKCSSCKKTYKDPTGLKKHEKSHLGSKNNVCDNCGKCFVSKTSLATHKRIHTGEKPYECKFCCTKFGQSSSLIMHQRRFHTGVKPYKCTQCKKRFVSKYELKNHYVAHSSEKKYNCVICNKWFKCKSILKKHILIHENKTKFFCDYCGFVCNYKINLASHISRMHSTKSGFCNICLKQESNITEHMGKHNGYRPYKCEYCPSKFLDKRGLQYHVNFKHTKSDKYKCDKVGCKASFPSRPMLNYHNNKVHTTVAPFPCDLCSRRFYRKSDYARHKVGTHKQKLDKI